MKHLINLKLFIFIILLTLSTTIVAAVLIGDANNDGRVDGKDYIIWLNHFGQNVAGPSVGDFDNNGTVNENDYIAWQNNYGSTGPTISPSPTPTRSPSPSPSRSPTASPTRSATPTPNITPPPSNGTAVWVSQAEIMARPTSGTSWNNLVSWAGKTIGTSTINDQDSDQDQVALAKALTCARIGTNCAEIITALNSLSAHTPSGDRALAWGRNISAWVMAADIVTNSGRASGLNVTQFKNWANTAIRTNSTEGETIIECHVHRPNNWSTMCGGSRIAADIFDGDSSDLTAAWNEYRGYVGDRSSGFLFANTVVTTNWRCPNSTDRTAINPKGCVKFGHNFDGILPAEMLRQGEYSSWPPPLGTVYPFNGLAGLMLQAELLARHGYPAFTVADNAMLRAYSWLIDVAGYTGTSRTDWMPWIINKRYGRSYPALLAPLPGQNIGFVEWINGN